MLVMSKVISKVYVSSPQFSLFKRSFSATLPISSSMGGGFGSRKEPKRFYQQVNVCESSLSGHNNTSLKMYEINLDKKKLKTPSGTLFQVDNEHLAHMIANEWLSQTHTIKQTTMHLTSLVNTCTDNPNKLTKETLIGSLCEYLLTDTLLFFDTDGGDEKLDRIQEEKWRPLVEWFNAKFDMKLSIQKQIDASKIIGDDASSSTAAVAHLYKFRSYLERNFDFKTLVAFNYMCECLKSVILAVALLERRVTSVDEACALANLEQSFQFDRWGKVEWYHDINEQELMSRVSAGLLFVYLSNSSKYLIVNEMRKSS